LRNIFPEESSTESDLPKLENTLTFENKVEILKRLFSTQFVTGKKDIELTFAKFASNESSAMRDRNKGEKKSWHLRI